jgi:endogenous inhibitor of DNA gyrase (YacG/DUF329 family)
MNQHQKDQILALRENGETFSYIAEHLGLSINTVKSFCRRNIIQTEPQAINYAVDNAAVDNTAVDSVAIDSAAVDNTAEDSAAIDNASVCPQCGKNIAPVSGRKPKKFCSDECRVRWWNSHSGQVSRKALYSFKCASCGGDFTAYGNSNRRYCSHACYCADRFGNSSNNKKQETAI